MATYDANGFGGGAAENTGFVNAQFDANGFAGGAAENAGFVNAQWNADAIILPAVAPTLVYRMRGYDETEVEAVFWASDHVDSTAADYGGPGPVVNIVVQKKLGT